MAMTETHLEEGHVHEVEINYTSGEIASKLTAHGLTPQQTYEKTTIDQTKLASLRNRLDSDSSLVALCEHISSWSVSSDPSYLHTEMLSDKIRLEQYQDNKVSPIFERPTH